MATTVLSLPSDDTASPRAGGAVSRFHVASTPKTCLPCGGQIPRGACFRRDRWPEPLFRHIVASTVCRGCCEAGL